MKLVSAIRQNQSLVVKVFRFVGYLLLLIGLSYQIQRLYKKLKIEPEIFSKESSIQSSQIPFPAVTVCPPTNVKNEAWNPEFLRLNNLTVNDLRGASLQICPNHDIYMLYNESDVNVVDVLLKSSPNFADNVYQCKLNKYFMGYQDCEKLFVRSVTEYGICYTFNMLGHDSLFNDQVSSDFDTFKRTKIAKTWDPEQVMNESRHENDTDPPTWSLEDGYLSDGQFVQPAKALKKQTLLLGVFNPINDSFCEVRDKNYEILLHLPNELPQLSNDIVSVPLGKEKTFLISAEMTYNEDSLRSFKPDKRGCYFEGEKSLKVFKSYTKANCEYECMTDFVNATCGCVEFSMPRTKDMKVCDFIHYSCISTITTVFPRSYYEDHENQRKFPDYPCGCLPSCTEIKYKVIKSEKSKPSEFSSETHLYADIKITFGDSQIKKTSNYVTYELENFIFDIGGLIGLFLGSSILSVLELLVNISKIIKSQVLGILNKVKSREADQSVQSVRSQSERTSIDTICSQQFDVDELLVEDLENSN
ncbi:unnamed protein product [Chironomus riparius]|uniref:Uncharacterized protein n=1 Tax=Chironomus riparius TaxID=315576 RepID=A0A9N9S8Y9_9DIPT|nr:unnamed protein product [Chironomus riparius]